MANPFDQFDVATKAGNPFDQFDTPAKRERTTLEAVKDVGAGLVSGAGALTQLPGQLYGLATGDFSDTGLTKIGRELRETGEGMKSEELKRREAERAAKIKEAGKEGEFAAGLAAFKETVADPALLTNFIAEQAPNLIPGFAVARGLRLAGAGAKAATAGAVGTGATQQGADIGAETFKEMHKKLVDQGMPPEEATGRVLGFARAAGLEAAVISLGAQMLPGGRAIERAMARTPIKGGRIVSGIKGGAGEAVSEMIEEGGGKVAQNLAIQNVDPTRSLTEGLGETMGMAAVGGLGLGTAAGVVSRREVPAAEPKPEPTAEPPAGTAPPVEPAPPTEPGAPTPPVTLAPPSDDAVAAMQNYWEGRPEDFGMSFADIQNRDRSRPASIQQMNNIAQQPDYNRLSVSRDFGAGAPVVISDVQIDDSRLGRIDMVSASDGTQIPVQYAVLDARQLTPSNRADGSIVPEYAAPDFEGIRPVAGNGRVAGIQKMYSEGPYGTYVDALMNDTAHGIGSDVISQIEQPVLVRIMPKSSLTPDIADKSNVGGQLGMSPTEQAKIDMGRFDLQGIGFLADGSPSLNSVRQFVAAMPKEEQANLINKQGQPTPLARMRLANALFAKAYANDALIDLYAETTDAEAKQILNGMAIAAPAMSSLEGAGDYDIRQFVAKAAQMAVNARRAGTDLATYVDQGDIEMDPLTREVVSMFAANKNAPRRIGDSLSTLAAEAQKAYAETQGGPDLFGNAPVARPIEDVFAVLRGEPTVTVPVAKEPKPPEEKQTYDIEKSVEEIDKEIDGMTPVQLADWLVDNAPNSFAKVVSEAISSRVKAMRDRKIPMSLKIRRGAERKKYEYGVVFGWTQPARYEVELNGPNKPGQAPKPAGTDYSTILHEMLHLATQGQITIAEKTKMQVMPGPIKDLENLRKFIRKKVNEDRAAGRPVPSKLNNDQTLKNVHELIAYSLSEIDVQRYLAGINFKNKNAFTRFVDAIRRLLAISKTQQSALERLVSLTEETLEVPVEDIAAGFTASGAGREFGVSTPQRVTLDEIPYDTVEFAGEGQPLRRSSGKAEVINLGGRMIVMRDVNGVKVPFYLSSGAGGKTDVPAGKWYPFFGVGPDGWINKTGGKEMASYYGSAALRKAAEQLDATIGDIRKDESIPKAGRTGRHIDYINRGLSPVANSLPDTLTKVRENINKIVDAVEQGGAATPEAANIRTPELRTKPVENWFEGVEKAAITQYKGKNKLVQMPIDTFLKLAKQDTPGDRRDKVARVEKIIDENGKFSSVPYLYIEIDSKGNAITTGHEGRHRARALKALGYNTIPVELRSNIRWSEQQDPESFDYQNNWPTTLVGENGDVVPFPVAREDSAASYTADSESPVITEARDTRTPEFTRWFGDSKIVDENGEPLRIYHGTTADITKFKVSKEGGALGNGIYATPDAEFAGGYAEQTGGNVMPLYASIKNPLVIDGSVARDPMIEALVRLGVDRAKAERIVEKAYDEKGYITNEVKSRAVAQGYDGITQFKNGKLSEIVAFNPAQLKTVFNLRPTESPVITEARETSTPEFRKWFGKSKLVDENGDPRVMYHGTPGNIFEFKPGQAEAIFVSNSPEAAMYFAELREHEAVLDLAIEIEQNPQAKRDLLIPIIDQAIADGRLATPENSRGFIKTTREQHIERALQKHLGDQLGVVGYGKELYQELQGRMLSSLNIMPLYVKAENPFDYDNPRHVKAVMARVKEILGEEGYSKDRISSGDWSAIEDETVQEAIKDLGFDGFYVEEGGQKNLAVYKSSQVKSVFTARPTESPVITESRKPFEDAPVDPSEDPKRMQDKLEEKWNKMRTGAPKEKPSSFEGVDDDLWNKISGTFFPQNKNIVQKIDGMRDRFWQRLAQGIADQYRTIKNYSEEAYMKARMAKTIDGALEGILFNGEVKLTDGALDIAKDTKGLLKAMEPVGAEVDRYQIWVALNRENAIYEKSLKAQSQIDSLKFEIKQLIAERRGVESVKEVNAINDEIEQKRKQIEALRPSIKATSINPDIVAKRDQLSAGKIDGKSRLEVYQQVQKDMNRLNRSVLNIALKQGLINREAYDIYANDINYIPFYKVMDEGGDVQAAATQSGLVNQYFSKALKGGEKPFGDLMENTLRNWSHILSASMKNEAANATIKAAMDMGGAFPNLKAGLRWEDGKVYSDKTDQMVGDGSLKPEYTSSDGKGLIKTMIDGKPAYFEVIDPLLLESIMSIGYMGPKSKFLDIARNFKNMLQFGVTLSPAFKVRNLFRDSISAIGVSDLKRNPFANVIQGWAASDRNNPAHISALAGGAIFNFGSMYEGDQAKLIKRLIKQGVKPDTILTTEDKIKRALPYMWRAYQDLGNKSESANRMALYQQMRDKGMSHLEASFYARDLLDFSMQGAWPALRLLTQTIPFLNARVQGLYKLGRDGIVPTSRVIYNVSTGKPIEATDKQKAEQFSVVMVSVGLASLMLYMAFKDDEEFQKREQWDRDNFWWFKLPGMENALRIPKPFEIGAFGTMVERVAEQIFDKGVEGKVFRESLSRMLTDTFAINPVPQVFKPLLDLYANKDSFTGAPIETAGMERLSKAERIAEKTSPLAIALSKVTNVFLPEATEVSPVQTDYAIKGYLGWMGGTASWASHYAVQPFSKSAYPDNNWTETLSMGFIKSLPATQSKYVTAFYENNKQIAQAYADMRHFAQLGEADKVQEILKEKGDKIAMAKFYDNASKDMSEIRKSIIAIRNDQNMPGDQKKEEIDRLKIIIGEIARQMESARLDVKKQFAASQ